jgi:hypothetical protein
MKPPKLSAEGQATYDAHQVRHHLDDFENAARAEHDATGSTMAGDMIELIAEIKRLRVALVEACDMTAFWSALARSRQRGVGRDERFDADHVRLTELRKLAPRS